MSVTAFNRLRRENAEKLKKQEKLKEEIIEENSEEIQQEKAELVEEIEVIKETEEINYSEMDYNELRKLAKEKNMDLGKNPKKEELITALEGE